MPVLSAAAGTAVDSLQTTPQGQGSTRKERLRRDQHPLLIFLLLLSVYLLFYSGQFHSADEESMLSVAETLCKVRWFDTPQRAFAMQTGLPITQEEVGTDGRLYSKKGWAWPLFLTPFYAISLLFPRLGGLQTAHVATLLVTACTGSLVYVCARALGFTARVSLLSALAFGLGTIALVYAKFLFAEPFVGLTLMGSVWALLRYRSLSCAQDWQQASLDSFRTPPCEGRDLHNFLCTPWKWAALGGLLFGLGGAARLATLFLAPAFGVYLLWLRPSVPSRDPRDEGGNREAGRWRRRLFRLRSMAWPQGQAGQENACGLLAFGLGALIPTLVSAAYNWARFGGPLESGYTELGFTTPLWKGLYGLLLSPGKGFFWFSPILLLVLPGTVWLWRRGKAEVVMIWALAAGTVLSYATWYMWWGGSAWGPRFLVPVAAPLTLLTLPVLDKALQRRRWAVLLGIFLTLSVAVQVLGSAVNFLHYGASLSSLDPRAEWTLAIYDVRYQPISGQLQFLRPEHLDLAWVLPSAGGQFMADSRVLAACLGAVLACAVGLLVWEKRGGRGSRGLVWLLAGLCIVVIIFGEVRLRDALVTRSGVRPWEQLYNQIAASARVGDVLFVQDGLGAETGYWLDRSRIRRYNWSPRPIPLDPTSGDWISRCLDSSSDTVERVWLASDRPALADPERGIERWLLDWGAKLFDRESDVGSRLVLFERTPRSLVEKTADVTFGDQVRLLRYAIPDKAVAPGEAVHVVLTWEAVVRPQFDYSVFVHLVDANGRICRQADGSPVGGLRPMSTWQEGELITDRYALLLPAAEECTPGDYRLLAGVYRWDTLERLPILVQSTLATGAETRDALDLGAVRIQGAQTVRP